MQKKVLVAMSGGVDSTVAAFLLKEQGYYVEGATMLLSQSAFSGQATVNAARIAADEIGIQHRVYDLSDIFEKKVIAPFIDDYKNGRTPNPCVLCNKYLKFGELFDRAMVDGFDFIATGHYAAVTEHDGKFFLADSNAGSKDQTYMLYNLTQNILSHLLLPLGSMNKPEVRKIAEKMNFTAGKAPDSEDICFVPDGDYAGFLKKRGVTGKAGRMLYSDGSTAGTHTGIINYTVGQRKGLGGGFDRPYYVTSVSAADNTVTIGENEMLFSDSVNVASVHFIGDEPDCGEKLMVKIRYNAKPASGTVTVKRDGELSVLFDSPQRAVTPGQSAVFYKDDILLGGGIIK